MFFCYVCQLGLNVEQLSKRLGLTIAPLEEWEKINREPEDYNMVIEEEKLELGTIHYHSYFDDRSISPETIQRYGVHWKFGEPQSAVLPVTNLKGKVIGAVHRYEDSELAGTRYKKFGDMTPVWPMHLLRDADPALNITVCEGAWSAMRLYTWFVESGHPDAVCLSLLGAKANVSIVDTLRPFKPIFLYDNDNAGTIACRKMRKLMPLAHSWTLSKAPDDMTDDEILVLLEKIVERR
jgi:hypothetical protein